MQAHNPPATTSILCLVIIFSLPGFIVADDASLAQKCLSLNGLSSYVVTTTLQNLCAIYV
uniref:Uncharacterized protein n=1 Tax=Plectus sambesii TaxID=2011161 RepID=A0A914V7W9_9BILA